MTLIIAKVIHLVNRQDLEVEDSLADDYEIWRDTYAVTRPDVEAKFQPWVDQLSKFDRALRDFSSAAGAARKERGIDGMLVTKWDTVDDKVL